VVESRNMYNRGHWIIRIAGENRVTGESRRFASVGRQQTLGVMASRRVTAGIYARGKRSKGNPGISGEPTVSFQKITGRRGRRSTKSPGVGSPRAGDRRAKIGGSGES